LASAQPGAGAEPVLIHSGMAGVAAAVEFPDAAGAGAD